MTIQEAIDIRDKHEARLMAIPDVLGSGVGFDGDAPVIYVFLLNDEAISLLPPEVDGVSIQPVVTGEITAA